MVLVVVVVGTVVVVVGVVVVVVVVGTVVVVVVEPLPGLTVNDEVVEAESPSASVTVRVAERLPASKVLVTLAPVAVVPSLKLQL